MENLIIFLTAVSVIILISSAFLLFINFKYFESDNKEEDYEAPDFLTQEEIDILEKDYLDGINHLKSNSNIDFNKVYELNEVYEVRSKIDNILK